MFDLLFIKSTENTHSLKCISRYPLVCNPSPICSRVLQPRVFKMNGFEAKFFEPGATSPLSGGFLVVCSKAILGLGGIDLSGELVLPYVLEEGGAPDSYGHLP